jgi:predicted sugar kinase
MIRVQAPSRLHFGLLSLPGTADADWPDLEGAAHMPARHFGGVGMMVDRPGVDLTITPAATWSAEGPGSERALRFARQYCESTSATHAFRLRIPNTWDSVPAHSSRWPSLAAWLWHWAMAM